MADKYVSDRKTFVDPETGNTVSGMMKLVPCERENFDIIYLLNFCDLFDIIGGKKYKILKYLLTHRNSENIVLATTREIAEETETSTNTVTKVIRILKSYNVIATRTGAIIINPQFIVHGSKKKEDWIFTKFVEIRDNSIKTKSNNKKDKEIQQEEDTVSTE